MRSKIASDRVSRNPNESTDNSVLIVGGYGQVGQVITRGLSKSLPIELIVAGRSLRRATNFSNQFDRNVVPVRLDLDNLSNVDELLKNVQLVIMCTDQTNLDLVARCMNLGIHYVDITASIGFIRSVEALNADARRSGAVAVLSVGLSPGLTNLLAKRCKSRIPDLKFVDIFLVLGLGDEHGDSAIHWMLENLNSRYSVMEHGKPLPVGSFLEYKKTTFPGENKEQRAYRFNFSDQHVVARTLQVNSVSTWLSFTPPVAGWFIYLLRKTGVSRLFDWPLIRQLSLKALKALRFGSRRFSVKAEAGVERKKGCEFECSVSGSGEARVTGLIAVKVAEQLLNSSLPPGVFHIEELFDLNQFVDELEEYQIRETTVLKQRSV